MVREREMVSFLHLLFFEHLNATQCFYTWYFYYEALPLTDSECKCTLCFIHSFTSVPHFLFLCVFEQAQCETAELMADSITPVRDRQVWLAHSFCFMRPCSQWSEKGQLIVCRSQTLHFSYFLSDRCPCLSVCLGVSVSISEFVLFLFFYFKQREFLWLFCSDDQTNILNANNKMWPTM